MDVQRSAEIIACNEWNATRTTEEAIHDYLVSRFGRAWSRCSLQSNVLCDGHVVYTAILARPVVAFDEDNYILESYTVDRDVHGRFYVAAPSPVAGYE